MRAGGRNIGGVGRSWQAAALGGRPGVGVGETLTRRGQEKRGASISSGRGTGGQQGRAAPSCRAGAAPGLGPGAAGERSGEVCPGCSAPPFLPRPRCELGEKRGEAPGEGRRDARPQGEAGGAPGRGGEGTRGDGKGREGREGREGPPRGSQPPPEAPTLGGPGAAGAPPSASPFSPPLRRLPPSLPRCPPAWDAGRSRADPAGRLWERGAARTGPVPGPVPGRGAARGGSRPSRGSAAPAARR